MASPALASISDLTARGADVSDSARVQAALSDASAFIRDVASPEDWLDDDGNLETVPDIIVAICCRSVQRSLDNPLGVTQQSEGIGSYNVAQTFGNASPDVYLTKAERNAVRRAAGLSSSLGAVTIESPYAPRNDDADIYLDVAGGGDPIPMGPWPNSSE